ncbi:ribonuclease H-like domain-containing protein [Tanacetum coccineum]
MPGISKPKAPMSLSATISLCPITRNLKDVLSGSNWKNSMIDEYNALIDNKTWELIPRTSDMHVIRSMWIFRHKLRLDGSFERYKARLVGGGSRNMLLEIIERADPTHYRSIEGALQYLTFTRPDISYVVQQICLHMHDPCEAHMTALKRIKRYIKGTLHYELHLYLSSSSALPTLSLSNVEAEYRGVANVVSESCWLRNLLLELRCPLQKAVRIIKVSIMIL